MVQVLVEGRDAERGRVVVHAEMRGGAPAPARGDQRRERAAPIGAQDRCRSFDHDLEPDRPRGEPGALLDPVEEIGERGDLLGADDLGICDEEPLRQSPAARLEEGREEQVERPRRAGRAPGGERLDANAAAGPKRPLGDAPRDLPAGVNGGGVLLVVGTVPKPSSKSIRKSSTGSDSSLATTRARTVSASSARSPMALARVAGSAAYVSSERSARSPSRRAVSARKRSAPPYTVWTGCRVGGSPGCMRAHALYASAAREREVDGSGIRGAKPNRRVRLRPAPRRTARGRGRARGTRRSSGCRRSGRRPRGARRRDPRARWGSLSPRAVARARGSAGWWARRSPPPLASPPRSVSRRGPPWRSPAPYAGRP